MVLKTVIAFRLTIEKSPLFSMRSSHMFHKVQKHISLITETGKHISYYLAHLSHPATLPPEGKSAWLAHANPSLSRKTRNMAISIAIFGTFYPLQIYVSHIIITATEILTKSKLDRLLLSLCVTWPNAVPVFQPISFWWIEFLCKFALGTF